MPAYRKIKHRLKSLLESIQTPFEKRVPVSVALYNLVTAALMVLMIKVGQRLAPDRKGLSWLAIVITTLLVAGLVLQAAWSGAMDTLDSDPSKPGWWRPITATFMQNGGVLGDTWNLITAAIVLTLAEAHWGRLRAFVLFVLAILVPHWIDLLLGGGAVSHQTRNWAGSSGTTYFLGATLAAGLLLATVELRPRLLALAIPVAGLASWLLQDNAHGLLTAEGFAFGLLVAAILKLLPARPNRRARPPLVSPMAIGRNGAQTAPATANPAHGDRRRRADAQEQQPTPNPATIPPSPA
jgi:hypothetical protein